MNKIKELVFGHIGLSTLGLSFGVVASVVNQNEFLSHSFLGSMAGTFGYWVIFGSIVALRSKTPLKAALNCFLFFLFMNTAFYCHEWITTGVFLTRYLTRWILVTLATPIGGYLVFYVKEEKWLGIISAALPILFLGAESITIFVGIANDKLVKVSGSVEIVPTSMWYIINDALNALIYLAFIGYLLYIFPKTRKRVLWLLAALTLVPIPTYWLFSTFLMIV